MSKDPQRLRVLAFVGLCILVAMWVPLRTEYPSENQREHVASAGARGDSFAPPPKNKTKICAGRKVIPFQGKRQAKGHRGSSHHIEWRTEEDINESCHGIRVIKNVRRPLKLTTDLLPQLEKASKAFRQSLQSHSGTIHCFLTAKPCPVSIDKPRRNGDRLL